MRRGPNRAARAGYPTGVPRCAAMAVGSVPHLDPRAAVELVLTHTPEAPAWPQLPRRSFLENMYVQFSEGLPGLVVDEAEQRIFVRNEVSPEELVEFVSKLETDDPTLFALGEDYAAALPVLGEALTGRTPPVVKGQVTGPVSFGLAVPREDKRALLYDDTLREVATRLLIMKARWQEHLLAGWSSNSLPLIMIDEPFLTQLGSGFVSIPTEISFPLLKELAESLTCLSGIHVCGGTDWAQVTQLPIDLLNFDAADHLDSLLAHRESVAEFLAEGGLLVWGVVPNDERARTETAETRSKHVLEGADSLAVAGAGSVDDILARSFVSPACGTGSLPVDLAERCLELTAEISAWLRARL